MLRALARPLACSGASLLLPVQARRTCSASASLHALSGTRIDGSELALAELSGKPVLMVNVASD